MSGPIVVAEEPVEPALAEVRELLVRTRTYDISLDRLRWMYLANPDGPAILWTVRQEGTLQGFTACLPRRMIFNGDQYLAWIGADFSMDPAQRTLGPAAMLRRQARLGIEAGRADFLYAHPNDRMAAVHRRVGHRPLGTMVRLARPLAIAGILGERIGGPTAGRIASFTLDPVLQRLTSDFWKPTPNVERLANAQFDQRFDELFERERQCRPFVGVRDSRYLNWRWRDHPVLRPVVYAAVDSQGISGYIVLADKDGLLDIRDIFPARSVETVDRLLTAALQHGWREGNRSISMTLLDGNPLLPILEQRGFQRRPETSESYVFAPEGSRFFAQIGDPQAWFMTSGDRDL